VANLEARCERIAHLNWIEGFWNRRMKEEEIEEVRFGFEI